VVVQTNPATGSEMNGGLVLTNEETREKFGLGLQALYPRVSILDPEVTLSIPKYVTACSGVDSMAHALEGYFTHCDPWAPLQERYVEGVVKTIMECIDRLMADPTDRAARATFMWATTLAWNGMQSTGLGNITTPSHMLEHPLSGLYDIAHGAGLAIIMPTWMEWAARTNPKPIARFARNVLGLGAGQSDAEAAKAGIAALRAWIKKIGLPTTFAEGNIPAGEIDEIIVPQAETLNKAWGVNYGRQMLAEIYHMCALIAAN
jgi:alcohol dehydrogenase YqhD (iron-dependent ADH family)